MRDLKAELAQIKKAVSYKHNTWPFGICARAIAAEAEVERLRKAALGVMDKWPDGGNSLENALWDLGKALGEGER